MNSTRILSGLTAVSAINDFPTPSASASPEISRITAPVNVTIQYVSTVILPSFSFGKNSTHTIITAIVAINKTNVAVIFHHYTISDKIPQ